MHFERVCKRNGRMHGREVACLDMAVSLISTGKKHRREILQLLLIRRTAGRFFSYFIARSLTPDCEMGCRWSRALQKFLRTLFGSTVHDKRYKVPGSLVQPLTSGKTEN